MNEISKHVDGRYASSHAPPSLPLPPPFPFQHSLPFLNTIQGKCSKSCWLCSSLSCRGWIKSNISLFIHYSLYFLVRLSLHNVGPVFHLALFHPIGAWRWVLQGELSLSFIHLSLKFSSSLYLTCISVARECVYVLLGVLTFLFLFALTHFLSFFFISLSISNTKKFADVIIHRDYRGDLPKTADTFFRNVKVNLDKHTQHTNSV